MDDLELMSVRADTLYIHDERGRMLHSNELDRLPAPRLFVGRAAGGHVIRCGQDVPDAAARELEGVIARQPPVAELPFPHAMLDELRAVLARQAPISNAGGGPAYRFPATLAPPSEVVQLTNANRALVRDTFSWLYDELADWWPCFAVVRDGVAVSVCFSSRIGAAAAEAGVDTLPDYRGRGYAVTVTAAWGAATRAAGRVPLYSTAWDNHASQGVARRLGLHMFGADVSWTEPPKAARPHSAPSPQPPSLR